MNFSKRMALPLLLFLLISCGGGGNSTSSVDTESLPSSSSSIIVSQNNNYENPIYPLVNGVKTPTYMADPFVFRDDDGTYYLYCTQTEVFINDVSRVFKRGPIFSSINGVDWVYAGDVFANYVPTWGKSNAGVWAPTIIKVGDQYNYYYSLSIGGDDNPGIGVAVGESPTGPWQHYGKLFSSNEIGVTNSIDPFVLYDNDKLFMAFGSYGGLITIVELEDDGLSLKGGLQEQFNKKVAIAGYELNEANNYEAVIIIKREGYYYMFLSSGTCCSGAKSSYNVVVAKSESLFGPYLDSKGRDMFGPKRGDYVVTPSLSGAMGVGHNGFLEDDNGDLWMIYHGYDTQGPKPDWRVTYIDKLIWDEETSLPVIENRRASNHVVKPGPYIRALES